MTTETLPRPTRTAPTAQPVTLRRVFTSEWIKLRSLRSTQVTLAVAFLLMVAISVVGATVTTHRWPTMSAGSKASFDPTTIALQGHFVARIAIAVLAVLVISGEYATGMIKATLTAVPRRLPVLWAKCTAFGAVTLVTMTAASFASFFIAQALLAPNHLQTNLSAPGVLRAVVGTGLYLTAIGLIGVALGTLLRNTAAAITALLGLLMLLPVLLELVTGSTGAHITRYLPGYAGEALITVPRHDDFLSPGAAFATLCAYAVIALAAAAHRLKHRDA
ncbi:ABC transporter permease (plasmid) [Embleya sp. NBC_00888]|uniref:ABC transporter permease subunit n=1 Tax=Embleya sp. NBC_00888 TaxID=2975960 RepID=UPI002F91B5A3|nr:ABC transporter permease [Embleya sp. NBC_00888]